MFPTLFGEGTEWAMPSYFAFLMIGFFVALVIAEAEGERQGFNGATFFWVCLSFLAIGVLGARVFHVLFDGYLNDYIALCGDPSALGKPLLDGSPCTTSAQCVTAQQSGADIGSICEAQTGNCVPEQDCFRTLKFWSGGLTWYGGFAFCFFAAIAFCRAFNWSYLRFVDVLAPCIALGQAFGRVGCYLSGCCYGQVCDATYGVHFPRGSEAWRDHVKGNEAELVAQHNELGEWFSLPVHPTQLYEAGALLIIFALLWFGLRTRKRFHGEMMGWFLVLYGMARFTIEFWRADARGEAFGVSTSQWISLVFVPIGLAMLVMGYQRLKSGKSDPLVEGGGDGRKLSIGRNWRIPFLGGDSREDD